MRDYPHLSNAPAEEAILDIRVGTDDDFDAEQFLRVHELIKDRFPQKSQIHHFQKEFQIVGASIGEKEQSLFSGYRFNSEDGRNVALFRHDGFTFSRLRPYTSWEQVTKIAYGLIELYFEARNPIEVSRVAVRYINQFDVAISIDKVGFVLTMPITVPSALDHDTLGFVSRIATHDKKTGTKSNILQSVEMTIDKTGFRVVLDIDVFRGGNFEPSLNVMRQIFEEIRGVKNDVFFGSIHEDKWGMFQ